MRMVPSRTLAPRRRVTALCAVTAAAALTAASCSSPSRQASTTTTGTASKPSERREAEFLKSLPARPADPTKTRLVSTLHSFAGCDALLEQLQRAGGEHVGSNGFNGPSDSVRGYEEATSDAKAASSADYASAAPAGQTLGTNVQVAGVDEPDAVKAVGSFVYDVRNSRLHITDTTKKAVVGGLWLDRGDNKRRSASVDSLLVTGATAVLFGQESVTSKPIDGDPSAATGVHNYLTVTTVDVTNPTAPKLRQRIRIDGNLVSARLVNDTVRMVTGSSLADIGFVRPTSPESIPTALEANRRSVVRSTIANWIPSWDTGGARQQLVECPDVQIPETFAGVSMTAMVQFDPARPFAPASRAVLAPSTDIYATATAVTVSSTVWVDPAVAQTAKFDRWDTALHRFSFGTAKPAYDGSTIVEGSIRNQFSFGEVGDKLGVVTSSGTPWGQLRTQPATTLTLRLLDQSHGLKEVSKLDKIGGSVVPEGVTAVRFTPKRVLLSGPQSTVATPSQSVLHVVDVADPTAPKDVGSLTIDFTPEYIHPVSDTAVLLLGSRQVPSPTDKISGYLVMGAAETSDAAKPALTGTWSVPNAASPAQSDHHAFLWWAEKKLAGFGVARFDPTATVPPAAALLGADGNVTQKGLVVPTEVTVAPPCPRVPAADLPAGVRDSIVLRCDQPGPVEWPGYSCSQVDDETLAAYVQDPAQLAALSDKTHLCSDNGPANVQRVMVVNGAVWLWTSESLEHLDDTLRSVDTIPLG